MRPAESNPKGARYSIFRAHLLRVKPGLSEDIVRTVWNKKLASGEFVAIT